MGISREFARQKIKDKGLSRKHAKYLANIFSLKMKNAGFNPLISEDIDDVLRSNGYLTGGERSGIVRSDEIIFNRSSSIQNNGFVSNFFVFSRIEVDKLTIFYTNPIPDITGEYSPEELYIKREIPITLNTNPRMIGKFIDRVINEIKDIAQNKDKWDYRYQIHFHMHHVLHAWDPIYDDGGSSGVSILRRLMLYHMDGFAPTPHNSVEPDMYKIFSLVSKKLNMTYIPGLELTATMYESNGPHHVVLFRSMLDALKFKNEVLSLRKSSPMPPYFIPNEDGLNIFGIYKLLNQLKREKRLTTFIAHPMIQEDKHLPLYVTGLMSGILAGVKLRIMDTSEIRLLDFKDVFELARQNEGISIYNASLAANTKMNINNKKLLAYLKQEMTLFRWKYGRVNEITPILATYLVGRRLSREFRLNTIYESDVHETKPLIDGSTPHYIAGGDKLGYGYTKVYIAKSLRDKLIRENRKLNTREFVEGIHDKTIRTKAIFFSRVEDGVFDIAKERKEPTRGYNFKTTFRIKFRRYKTYLKGIIGAALEFIANGKIDLMKYLTK